MCESEMKNKEKKMPQWANMPIHQTSKWFYANSIFEKLSEVEFDLSLRNGRGSMFIFFGFVYAIFVFLSCNTKYKLLLHIYLAANEPNSVSQGECVEIKLRQKNIILYWHFFHFRYRE